MGNFIGKKKCNICNKNQAVYYRCLKDKHYFICSDSKCNFLSLLRAGMMKKRDFKTQ